jgi:hypothetical protein
MRREIEREMRCGECSGRDIVGRRNGSSRNGGGTQTARPQHAMHTANAQRKNPSGNFARMSRGSKTHMKKAAETDLSGNLRRSVLHEHGALRLHVQLQKRDERERSGSERNRRSSRKRPGRLLTASVCAWLVTGRSRYKQTSVGTAQSKLQAGFAAIAKSEQSHEGIVTCSS